ncbi:MAG: hypothetical protein OEQ28_02675 [Acidobacteriota bacterium]|nr:hypothetical protein [Acidobacteriota bacterium]
MIFPRTLNRSIATATLIFANFIFLNAQTELPAGTRIPVRMDNGITSESAGVDDTFTAVTTKPLFIDGVSVLSAGSSVVGRVVEAKPAGNGGKAGRLEVEFETLRFTNGTERKIKAVLVENLSGRDAGVLNALAVIGGAAAGGIIGLVSKVKNGAAIGAGIGGGAGAGIALSRKGKNVGIDSDQDFEIELTRAVTLPADGY